MGALIGLLLAIILIIRRVSPFYALLAGAVVGGLAGGSGLEKTTADMVTGVKDITPAIIRILSAGVLSGVMIKTGAAASISQTIIAKLGNRHVYLALALSTLLLTGVGVFIDVAVITVAPIALMIGKKLSIQRSKLLVAMIGGGKCGNIISPNPNTIIAAENFDAPLSSVMFVNLVPAFIGMIITVYVAVRIVPAIGGIPSGENETEQEKRLPTFWASMIAPVVSILLLALRPLFGIVVDPLLALPIGGLAGIAAMNKWRALETSIGFGLEKMSGIAVLLAGTGAIAGIISASTISENIVNILRHWGTGELLIAPLSGALMSAAAASTTAGATIASASFAQTILGAGIAPVWGAAMVNSGATVLDHLPHGSFFHATGGAVELNIKERLRLIAFESLVGLTLAVSTVVWYLVIGH